MITKAFLSVLLSSMGPVLLLFAAYWKRKQSTTFWAAASLGFLFLTINVFWGLATRHFVIESDIFRERFGHFLSSFYQDWYFAYFHLIVFLGFIYLIMWRRNQACKSE